MARTKNQHKGDTAQAHGMPFLKLAFGAGLALVLCVAMDATAQNLLKGNVLKQINAQPNTDLVDRYGDAANDPAVADALRKAQGNNLTPDEIKAKAEAYEALQNGTFKPGADPTMALMYGYVPPNMSPEQAAIMAQHLPKMPRMPHPPTPEDIARMAGEPEQQRTAIEPAEPYIPYPESFAKAHGIPTSRKLQMIPQQNFPGQLAGMQGLPNVPGMPVMGFGPGTGIGTGIGLSQEEIRAQNQRIAEECIRARYGPVNVPILQPGHSAIAEQARKNAASQHIAESDHQSVVGVVDSSGNEITGISYDSWGNSTVLHGGTVMPDAMFKGMYPHQRSGLYLTLHRVYDPKNGRWLSRDPMGERAGTNLYAYCGNDPINRWDPFGLSFTDLGGGEAGIGPGGSLGQPVDNPVGAKCLSQCASKFPVLGPLLTAGGLPIIPVSGKLGGAIQGTSFFSAGLRASPLGGVTIPPTWAPTATFPFNQTTTSLGGALGRWAPIVGAALTAAEYADFMNCIQDCENPNNGGSCSAKR